MEINKKRLASVIGLICLSLGTAQSAVAATDLYISEYVEGSSYNKALEIYNGTGASVDLSAYEFQFYFNGAGTPGRTINLSGVIPNGQTFVLAHSSADAPVLSVASQTSGGSWFNGDDAVVLLNGGVAIDAVGQIAVDPGTQWGSGVTSTQNNTLRRMSSLSGGDSNAYDAFDPALQWDGFAQDDFSDLGVYAGGGGTTPPPPPPTVSLLINELDADTTGADTQEFIELYDGGVGNTDLSGHVLVLFNGSNDSVYAAFDLAGYSTDANGYFVLGNALINGVDIVFANGLLQNGADAAALYQGSAADFPNGTPVSTNGLVDAIVYGTSDASDAGLLALLNNGELQVDEAAGGNKDLDSNQRCPNGGGGARNTSTYSQALPTVKGANACGGVISACGTPATAIHSIQGSGASSPLSGTNQTVEAVVVGDFQSTSNGLKGFFVQEEDTDADTNALTSEGLFIYDNGFGVNVQPGDVVRVTGQVSEAFGLTELTTLTDVTVCASGAGVTPASLTLPFASATSLEAYEGMSVQLGQSLTVTENYNLGRYGELWLSSGGRLFIPTNVVAPGAPAQALQAQNDLNRILIDDGNAAQNPDPVVYPAPGLSAFNTVRAGDTVTGVRGVLSYDATAYRVHPTTAPSFFSANPRSNAPALVGTGSLRIASFNVLNYFNGNGTGGGFPTARGADTASEFTRQRDKIINAISAMDADIIGLMELENDGYGANSAIQDLVNGLNAVASAGTVYAFVDPGLAQLGGDAIAVGFIYRSDKVTAVGAPATLSSYPFDTSNRQPLAQTFDEKLSGARLTLAVNHFKSKGCGTASGANADQGDGQGCWNLKRTEAANALSTWLASDPTGSADADFLVIGDLNAYAKEDPIAAFEGAGYVNLIARDGGASAYSYVYKGQSGYLDHALANAGLAPQVVKATEWAINADEPRVLDYNEEFKSAGQLITLYDGGVYRASDHDPVVIELNLTR